MAEAEECALVRPETENKKSDPINAASYITSLITT